MELYVPSLSPMRNAIQLACGSGGRHKYYFKLSISLVLFSLPTATLALTPRYSPATQCGRFSVSWTWGESSRTTKPPFYLLILPFDAQATILELPRYSYDVNTYAGNFTTPDGLRLKSGTQYIVCMGDGDGKVVGGISSVQTVGDSSNSSCITPDASPTSSFFTLDPTNPPQCSPQTVLWNSTRYTKQPNIRAFAPCGRHRNFVPPNSTSYQTWEVNIREGTQIVLLVRSAPPDQGFSWSDNARTSPLITVTGKQNDGCFGITTEPVPGNQNDECFGNPTEPVRNIKVTAVAGGVAGGLGFIAVCAAIILYWLFRCKNKARPFASYGLGNSSDDTGGVTVVITKTFEYPSGPSTGRNAASRTRTADDSGNSYGQCDSSGDSSTRPTSPGAACATRTDKAPLDIQGQTEYPHTPQQSSTFLVPLERSPVVPSADSELSHQWEDPSIAYGVPTTDLGQPELGNVFTHSASDTHSVQYHSEPEQRP